MIIAGLLVAAAAFMLAQFDVDTMHVPLILVGMLGYMFATRNTSSLRFNPVFAAALVCLFGVCMAVYAWMLLVQGSGVPAVGSALFTLAACSAAGARLVPTGVVACAVMRHTGRNA